MTSNASAILLWLFVLNLGTAFGAGLYEHRIVVPRWLSASPDGGSHWNAEAACLDDSGRRFWAFVTTLPLTLLALGNLWVAWTMSGPLRWWWLVASGAALADRALTFSYFIPTMVGLMGAPDSSESVAIAARWRNLNLLRHAMVLAAWLAALRAFSLFHRLSA